VTLQAVTFSPMTENAGGFGQTIGVATLAFDGAAETCGWTMTISFSDFTSGDSVIPAANVAALQVSGEEGLLVTSEGGAIAIVSPAREAPGATSGAVVLDLVLSLTAFAPQGDYHTTVTVEAAPLE
jgi:hypothetical protein